VPIQGGIGRVVRRVDGTFGGECSGSDQKVDEGGWGTGGKGESVGSKYVIRMVRGFSRMGRDASKPDVYCDISIKPEGGIVI